MTEVKSKTDVNILRTKVCTRHGEDPELLISDLEKVAFRLVFEDQSRRACRQPVGDYLDCTKGDGKT